MVQIGDEVIVYLDDDISRRGTVDRIEKDGTVSRVKVKTKSGTKIILTVELVVVLISFVERIILRLIDRKKNKALKLRKKKIK